MLSAIANGVCWRVLAVLGVGFALDQRARFVDRLRCGAKRERGNLEYAQQVRMTIGLWFVSRAKVWTGDIRMDKR
jgi:hypothetical protein